MFFLLTTDQLIVVVWIDDDFHCTQKLTRNSGTHTSPLSNTSQTSGGSGSSESPSQPQDHLWPEFQGLRRGRQCLVEAKHAGQTKGENTDRPNIVKAIIVLFSRYREISSIESSMSSIDDIFLKEFL